MVRHLLMNGIRLKLVFVLLGAFAFAAPAFTPVTAAAQYSNDICAGVGSSTHSTLQRGDTGPAVTHLQCLLNAYPDEDILVTQDGIFGPKTEEAVKLLQSRRDLEVDGIVGPCTWDELHLHAHGCS